MSLKSILDPAQQEVVREERRILNDLRTSLIRFGASDENMAPLERSIEQLDELFLLVVVGEFNAGKSAFINALTGERRMEEGVTPTTAQVTPVRYEDINIVDTPGTNAVIREHEEITSQYVPRADLVLFVTSADRPFTETERLFLEQIRDWGKKVVVVINKVDILAGEKELGEVRAYVADNARRLLGVTPEIFPVSAKAAFRAKTGEPQLWSSSGFEPLERYIRTTLDAAARMQPEAAESARRRRRADRSLHGRRRRERLSALQSDFALLDDVEGQLGLFEADMAREFEGRMASVDNVLLEMERRGHDYFDDTMRIGRVMDLLNRSRVQEGFERQVVADAPQQIEKRVNELIDWMVDAGLPAVAADHATPLRAAPRVQGPHRRSGERTTMTSRGRFMTSGGAWSRPSGGRRRPSSIPTIAGAKRASWPTARAMPSRPRPRRARARSGSGR